MFDKFSVPLDHLSLRSTRARLAMIAKEAAKPGGLPRLGLRRKFEPGDVTVLVEHDEKIPAGWCVDPQTVRAVGGNSEASGVSVGAEQIARPSLPVRAAPQWRIASRIIAKICRTSICGRGSSWGLH